MSKEQIKVNKEINKQLGRVEGAEYVEELLPLFTNGRYNTKKNVVELSTVLGNKNLKKDVVKLHEFTHALGQDSPQEFAIRQYFDKKENKDKYLDNPSEIYARLMTFRKLHNIDPNHIYTKDDIKKLRQETRTDFDEVITKPWRKHDNLDKQYRQKLADYLIDKVVPLMKNEWWFNRSGGRNGIYNTMLNDSLQSRQWAKDYNIEIPNDIEQLNKERLNALEDKDELRNIRYNEDNDFFKRMTDDDMLFLLNNIAQNNKENKNNRKQVKYGGIHIKPSKRGTFTAAANQHGMSVQGFASKVLANKDNYSPAMVKKANFARNASKWKHKELGGDMDFNYWITKDNIYKFGGRKKALNGADYLKLLWNEDNTPTLKFSGLNVDIPKVPTLSYSQRNNISIQNPIKRDEIGLKDISDRTKKIINNALSNNSRLLEPPLQNTIDRNDALRIIASNQPTVKTDNPIDIGNIGNLIGTGINIAGNLISYGINNRALNRMRRPSMPLPLRAENLQTRVSTAAQEAAIRENVAGQEGLISGNLASSRSRLNAINRVRNQGTSMYNQLQDRKQNIETELINRNKLNRQQIGNQNVLQFNNWRDRVTEFDNRITDLRSENKVNLTQGIADAIAGERGYLANRENDARYRMNAFLTTIANPDAFNAMNSAEIRRLARQFGITNRQLKDLGINV